MSLIRGKVAISYGKCIGNIVRNQKLCDNFEVAAKQPGRNPMEILRIVRKKTVSKLRKASSKVILRDMPKCFRC